MTIWGFHQITSFSEHYLFSQVLLIFSIIICSFEYSLFFRALSVTPSIADFLEHYLFFWVLLIFPNTICSPEYYWFPQALSILSSTVDFSEHYLSPRVLLIFPSTIYFSKYYWFSRTPYVHPGTSGSPEPPRLNQALATCRGTICFLGPPIPYLACVVYVAIYLEYSSSLNAWQIRKGAWQVKQRVWTSNMLGWQGVPIPYKR